MYTGQQKEPHPCKQCRGTGYPNEMARLTKDYCDLCNGTGVESSWEFSILVTLTYGFVIVFILHSLGVFHG